MVLNFHQENILLYGMVKEEINMKKYISIILALILLGSLTGCAGFEVPSSGKFAKCLEKQMVIQLLNQNIECPNPQMYHMDHAPPTPRNYYLKCRHHNEQSTHGVSNEILVLCNRKIYGEP